MIPHSSTTNTPRLGVLGLSRSGEGAVRLASQLGMPVWLSDAGELTPEKQRLLEELQLLPHVTIEVGGHSEAWLNTVERVILSPGVPPHAPIVMQLHQQGIVTETDVSFALRQLPSSVRWVGITGSNGKSTVTLLLTHLLNYLAIPAMACGNVGVSVAGVVAGVLSRLHHSSTPPPVLVVELSSYQLHHSPCLQTAEGQGASVALFTNLTPDHLQWHGSLDAYQEAKARLFFNSPCPSVSVLNANDATAYQWLQKLVEARQSCMATTTTAQAFEGLPSLVVQEDVICYVSSQGRFPLMPLEAWSLLGRHNLENLQLCLGALLGLGVLHPEEILEQQARLSDACRSFQGVEHRLEPVPHPLGIRCYNDSKATNPEAAITALKAVDGYAVFYLAGGQDKGTPLEMWATCVVQACTQVVLYGASRHRFASALREAGLLEASLTLVETLQEAYPLLLQGLPTSEQERLQALILFSPAAASQDQYQDFEQRGKHFKALVQNSL